MRILQAFFFIVFLSFSALAQTQGSLMTVKGNFDFDNPDEQVITYRFLEGGAKLWMLGKNTVQIWDVRNNKVISSRRHGIEDLSIDTFGGLSPDGSKLFFKRHKYVVDDGIIRSAFVFDLNTLKKLRGFDEKMRGGEWSKTGRVFVTVAMGIKPDPKKSVKDFAVSFWDGETMEPRKTITVQDLDWWYLSPDGEQFFSTSVPTKKWLFGIPYSNGMANVISVWNTRTGQNEKNLSVGGEDFAVLTWKLMPSPSGRYIAMVSKHKSDEKEHRLLFWDLDGGDAPKYSIKANPQIADSNIRYSPDEQLFAIDSGRNIQIYQAGTGQKKAEVLNTNLPDYWLADNQIILTTFLNKMRAFNVATGSMMYENPLYFDSYERSTDSTTDANGNTTYNSETEITDQTLVVPHPDGKIYLTYSNQYVRLYKVQTGELIETIIHPIFTVVKPKKALREKKLVRSAGWTEDGKTLFVINAEGTIMSLWDFKDN
jgi:WD40 repeat protein